MLSTVLTVFLILDLILLLIFIIGLQQGTDGGMAATLGGSGNTGGFFGASGGIDLIVGLTWILGLGFFALSLSLAWVKTNEYYSVSSELKRYREQITNQPKENSIKEDKEAIEAQSQDKGLEEEKSRETD